MSDLFSVDNNANKVYCTNKWEILQNILLFDMCCNFELATEMNKLTIKINVVLQIRPI